MTEPKICRPPIRGGLTSKGEAQVSDPLRLRRSLVQPQLLDELLNLLDALDPPELLHRNAKPARERLDELGALRGKAQPEEPPRPVPVDLGRGREHEARRGEDGVRLVRDEGQQRLGQHGSVEDGQAVALGLPERVVLEVDADPDEHAAAGPVEGQQARLGDDAPVGVVVEDGRGLLELVGVLVEGGAHGVHAALVGASEALEPADPAVHLPAFEGVLLAAREGEEGLLDGLGLGTHDELGDGGLDEARGLLGGGLGDAAFMLVISTRQG